MLGYISHGYARFHMCALWFNGCIIFQLVHYFSHGCITFHRDVVCFTWSMLFHMGAIYRYIMFQMGTLCFIGFIASHWCTMFHSGALFYRCIVTHGYAMCYMGIC